ncbi:MAG TPA: hypothetical protein VNY05_25045 [Candidatus Acidoferrales bacterium]|jgi:hypothetical protein|nr:hypothetical protein [Candidatus Acidoferrales bacterium]
MKTFEQFVSESAKHGSVNLIFESGMHSLVNDLEGIVKALQHAGVKFEVVGGVAVNAHILALQRSRSFVTRDIYLLVNRGDLQRIAEAAVSLGYHARKMMGGYTLIRPEQELGEAIHLIFAGERSKSTQPLPHPALNPEDKHLFGITIPVAPLTDLLQMKLSSLRPKDIIHLETLDEVGLITPVVERGLSPILRERLKEAREQIAENKPDVEG